MQNKLLIAPFILSLSLCATFGCQKKQADTESATDGAAEQKTAAEEAPSEEPKSNKIEIKGSDSEVNAVQRMAEKFMESHPEVKIAVTGGGSGTGIASLFDKTVDIANSSRPLAPAEKIQAVKKGVKPVATVFATDALSIAVHPDNPVKELTVDQLRKIFSGEATDWKEFGGEGKITAYGRQPSSGTYVFFKDAVVKGDYGDKVLQMNGNAQIVESIAQDKGGIGYVAVGYIKKPDAGIKALAVSNKEGEPGILPTNAEAVAEGKYPIARPLFQYTNGEPEGVVKDFMLFELSPEGKQVALDMGFYPVRTQDAEQNKHLTQ